MLLQPLYKLSAETESKYSTEYAYIKYSDGDNTRHKGKASNLECLLQKSTMSGPKEMLKITHCAVASLQTNLFTGQPTDKHNTTATLKYYTCRRKGTEKQ